MGSFLTGLHLIDTLQKRNAFSDRWKEADMFDKLRLSLWGSPLIFDERMRHIRGVVE
jgi:hypothetical protein